MFLHPGLEHKEVPRAHLAGLIALLFLSLLLLSHSWHGPDIWYHLTWGRDFIQNGKWLPTRNVVFTQPIAANGYILFQSIVYGLYQIGGIWAVSGLFAFLWIAIACLWLRITGFDQKAWSTPIVLAALIVMQLRFEHRPEVFSYFFLTLMIWFSVRRQIFGLVAVQILWTNTHGYFVFGPFVAWLALQESGVAWKRATSLAMGLLLATLVTPFGWNNWIAVWNYAQLGQALRDINHELMPPSLWPLHWTLLIFWLSWLATLIVILKLIMRRESFSAVGLAALGLILSAQASRNMPLLFLLGPLIWRRIEWKKSVPVIGWSTLVVALAFSGTVVTGAYHRSESSLSSFGVKLEWASYPIGAADFLQAIDFKGKLFCDSYDGGYLEYHLPALTISGDSYFADPFMTRAFFAAIRDPKILQRADQTAMFNGFLINIENPEVVEYLLDRQDLTIGYADSHRILFLQKAMFPDVKSELSSFHFYHGEDLRDVAYEFGVVAWMDLAYRHQWTSVIFKILSDLSAANTIPKSAFQIALKYASEHQDQNLILALAPLKDRVRD